MFITYSSNERSSGSLSHKERRWKRKKKCKNFPVMWFARTDEYWKLKNKWNENQSQYIDSSGFAFFNNLFENIRIQVHFNLCRIRKKMTLCFGNYFHFLRHQLFQHIKGEVHFLKMKYFHATFGTVFSFILSRVAKKRDRTSL